MHSRSILAIMILSTLLSGTALGELSVATPAPSTQPTYTVHGHIKAAGNLDHSSIDLTRAVVYFESDPTLDAVPIDARSATMSQMNKAFTPNFLATARGTTVEFPNWDQFSHNVFSRSAAAPPFDLGRYAYGSSNPVTFKNAGVIQVFCNIHPYMKGIIVVTPNRFFAKPDAVGHFTLNEIPGGTFQLTAWQERCGKKSQPVEVGAATPDLEITISEDRQSILLNDPPRQSGNDYGVQRGLGIKRNVLNLPTVNNVHPAPTSQPCPDCQ